jgi:hypothetical protein
MASGFGSILAKMAISERQAQFAENPACPLCGEPMSSNGTAWFCDTPEPHRKWLRERMGLAYEAQGKGQVVFHADLKHSPKQIAQHMSWDPEMQGVILAVCPQPQQYGEEEALLDMIRLTRLALASWQRQFSTIEAISALIRQIDTLFDILSANINHKISERAKENAEEFPALLFSTTRGGMGRTNFRVDYPATPGFVPQLENWVWAEWAKEEIATG